MPAVRHILDLDGDLLDAVLRLSCVYETNGTRIQLPHVAQVCQRFRAALVTPIPHSVLTCAGVRQDAAAWNAWAEFGGFHKLRPAVLDLAGCDIRVSALAQLLKCTASRSPLRALCLRKCHSIGPDIGLPLLLVPRLGALVCSKITLGAEALAAIGKLRELQMLSLIEATLDAAALHTCLLQLGKLRALLLGGARFLEMGDTRTPAIMRCADAAACGGRAAAAADDDAPWAGPRLIDVSFIPQHVRDSLRAAFPRAEHVDLCEGSPAIFEGASRLRSLLDDVDAEVGGCGVVADAAYRAALSSRCLGFHDTALHHASIVGDRDAAAFLLAHGAAPDLKDAKGNTPLLCAIFWGHAPIVELLLSVPSVDLDVSNHNFEGPCYLAALRGHAACLRLLLASHRASGVDSTACKFHDGYTPLHAAVIGRGGMCGEPLSCIHLLLAAGFAPDDANKYAQTPLHLAARLGVTDAVGPLLAAAALPKRRADAGVAAAGSVRVHALLRAEDERGHTACRVASLKGHLEISRLLEPLEAELAAAAPGHGKGDADAAGGEAGGGAGSCGRGGAPGRRPRRPARASRAGAGGGRGGGREARAVQPGAGAAPGA